MELYDKSSENSENFENSENQAVDKLFGVFLLFCSGLMVTSLCYTVIGKQWDNYQRRKDRRLGLEDPPPPYSIPKDNDG